MSDTNYNTEEQSRITEIGNPAKPQGSAGEQMLCRMNDSHSAVTDWAFNYLHFKDNDRILDIGCGGGAALAKLSKLVPNGKLNGIDYSPTSVKVSTQTNFADIQSGKMQITEASVDNIPFDDNTFDKVITVESFYFWPNPQENLKEVLRVLNRGGCFLLIADIYGKDDINEQTLENIRKYNLFNPTIDEFKDLFENAGFRNISVNTKSETDWICISGTK